MRDKKKSWFLIAQVIVLLLLLTIYIGVRVYYIVIAPFTPFERLFSLMFFFAETFILFHSFFFFVDVLRENLRPIVPLQKTPDKDASVAILIPARHESKEIVETTLLTCKNIAYENKNVYLLDDSTIESYKREARELSEKLGVNLFTRSNNRGAKAGMINEVLKTLSEKYIAIFDADQNPMPVFLKTLVPFLEADDRLAFVQTPQFYSNGDSSTVAMIAHNQQAIFYEYICLGKTINKAMFCCGTNVVFRRSALNDVGNFDEATVTEDIATSLKLHTKNWKSFFIHKAYTFGMAPEDLAAYFTQQNRWALGTSQLFRKLVKIFFTDIKSLRPEQWLEYFISTTYYFIGIAYFVLMAGPIMYIFLDINSYNIDSFIYSITFIPFFILSNSVFYGSMVKKKYKLSNMIKVQMLTALSMPVYLSASIVGVLNISKKGFQVTPKGNSNNVPWKNLWPQLLLIFVVFITFAWGSFRLFMNDGVQSILAINVFWMGFQLILLSGLFHFNRK
jgi:cellulose synthase (UDP-forming)